MLARRIGLERLGYVASVVSIGIFLVYFGFAVTELVRASLLPEEYGFIMIPAFLMSALFGQRVPYMLVWGITLAVSAFVHGLIQITLTQVPGYEMWVTILGLIIALVSGVLAFVFFVLTRRAVKDERLRQIGEALDRSFLDSREKVYVPSPAPELTCWNCGVTYPQSETNCDNCGVPLRRP